MSAGVATNHSTAAAGTHWTTGAYLMTAARGKIPSTARTTPPTRSGTTEVGGMVGDRNWGCMVEVGNAAPLTAVVKRCVARRLPISRPNVGLLDRPQTLSCAP